MVLLMADRLPAQGTMLLGRGSECQVFDRLLDAARGGRSGTLVVRGEAGVGKTALLQYAIASASDLRVVRAAGVESEMELPFAALHQLCGPLLDGLERLPAPQADALATAFGLRVGAPPDRFFVGLAVLSLLSEAAGERPLLCVVDDAQWLDRASAQTLAFVARRLFAESVVLMFAAREPGEELRGLPDLVVQGLPDRYARELLSEVVRWPLDVRVREQILAETRGNPLALLELPRGLSPAQLAGGFGLPRALSLSGRIEESFLRRFEALPSETQRLLLLAAAESTGDPSLLWRAAERLGIGRTALEPAERAGLLEVGNWVRFRHPLVRSAVYRAASAHERQDVHRVLAEAIDPETEPDRRAWHRAEATLAADEDVAADLERSAGRARARGGLAASAAFLERAVRLTLDPALRTRRALAAAQAKFEAAAPGVAYELLAIAEMGPVDELQRARLERLRTQIAFAQKRSSDVPPLLLDTAKRLEPLDPQLARETYLEALGAAIFAGRESADRGVFEAAQAARAAPPAARPPRPIDLLLDGLTTRFTEPYAAALPPLRRALHAVLGDQRSEQTMRWPWLACPVTPEPLAPELWDDKRWEELASRAVRLARDAGALTVLPIALTYRAHVHVHAGEFAAASALIDEADALARAAGNAPLRYTSLVLVAWRGDEATARNVIAASIQDATARGEGRAIGLAHYATAVLDNGLGRYGDALAAAQRACAHEDLAFFGWALVELVEAGARGDAHKVASDALCRLGERTRASGTDWALGIQARSEALLSEGEAAESLYREAIQRLARSRIAVHVARGHLVYGEWLRRERRRVDAREQLRTALEMFTGMGAEAFAERASAELLATGERARKRTVETREDLTAQEAQIARLARDGLSNPEIGARLFISPRTVEYHLHKVFAKLDISSRNELDRALPREPGTAVAV
jgi:DNA-binding CsgD family transcriptional regulator